MPKADSATDLDVNKVLKIFNDGTGLAFGEIDHHSGTQSCSVDHCPGIGQVFGGDGNRWQILLDEVGYRKWSR